MNAAQMLQPQRALSREYFAAFYDYIRGGRESAALYEGVPSGGAQYLVPTFVDGRIIPFPAEVGAIRRLAYVIPTTEDIRFTPVASPGVVTSKVEGAPFGTTSATLTGGVTLRAFMAGAESLLSVEILADVPAFINRLAMVMVPAQNAREEHLFLHGSGINEPQGLLSPGAIGTGVNFPSDAAGNLVSIDATDSLIDTLPAQYHGNASWLMSRATGRMMRKAQRQQGLVDRVWTREGGRDMLHGFPVEYSSEMPDAAPGVTSALLGDFKQGLIVGDRGGSDICVKVIDQDPNYALAGVVSLLTWRRTDSRVVRPEAIQPLVCAS